MSGSNKIQTESLLEQLGYPWQSLPTSKKKIAMHKRREELCELMEVSASTGNDNCLQTLSREWNHLVIEKDKLMRLEIENEIKQERDIAFLELWGALQKFQTVDLVSNSERSDQRIKALFYINQETDIYCKEQKIGPYAQKQILAIPPPPPPPPPPMPSRIKDIYKNNNKNNDVCNTADYENEGSDEYESGSDDENNNNVNENNENINCDDINTTNDSAIFKKVISKPKRRKKRLTPGTTPEPTKKVGEQTNNLVLNLSDSLLNHINTKKLKKTNHQRSPGGTPLKQRAEFANNSPGDKIKLALQRRLDAIEPKKSNDFSNHDRWGEKWREH